MSDEKPNGARASRRGLAALVALAFVAGLTLMGYAARQWGWFATAPAATEPTRAVSATTPTAAPTAVAPPVVAAPDPTMLGTREATLAGQLSALEARTAAITADANGAGNQAARAEALLVAVAARRQVDAGQPLGYLEEQLRERFGSSQPRAVALLIAAARRPVTLDDLATGLELLRARLMAAPQDDILDGLRREIANLVVLRRVGTPSPLPADRIAHARRLLTGGQVEAARAEVAALPGAAVATGWLAAARRWVLARQALDALEASALTVPPPVAPIPVQAPAPTTAILPG